MMNSVGDYIHGVCLTHNKLEMMKITVLCKLQIDMLSYTGTVHVLTFSLCSHHVQWELHLVCLQ